MNTEDLEIKILDFTKKSTIILFHNSNPRIKSLIPESVGSGILLKWNNKHYVVTAAHVVEDYALKKLRDPYKDEDDYDDPSEAYLSLENIGILTDSFYTIGEVFFVNTYKGNIENIVDIAIIKIEDDLAQDLERKYRFLTEKDVILNNKNDNEIDYYMYGYPSCFVDTDYKKLLISSTPFCFRTKACIEGLIPRIYNPLYNILVKYDKKNIDFKDYKNDIESFQPNGISGCGLWIVDENLNIKLVGIMTENLLIKEGMPYMRATKIDEVIYIIGKME